MRRMLAAVVVVTMGAVLGGVGIGLAGASAPAKNATFCSRFESIDTSKIASLNGIDKNAAGEIASGLRNAAKAAPTKVRKAGNTLASALERVADGEQPLVVLATGGTKYIAALAKFFAYAAAQCSNVSVPSLPASSR